jgi:sugar O-acyltransferase (sialic acid O-acetyltransferase NeuD family)
MATRDIVIFGAGGHGREVLDLLRAQNSAGVKLKFIGFVADDEPDPEILARIGANWLGTVDEFLSNHKPTSFVIGIANPAIRKDLAGRCEAQGLEPVTLIHPSATFGADVILGNGVVIASHVSITTNVHIFDHAHINLNSTVSHDSRISRFVTISPCCSVSGNVTLHEKVFLGTNSTILQGLTVGEGSTVGAGSVVLSDVGEGTTVVGVPAYPIGSSR